MKKLAVITTHPIQYNAPLFELLAKRGKLDLKVFYTWGRDVLESKYDPGFQREVAWDIPLLEGYAYTFVNNVAKQQGSHHFSGINNPTLCSEITDWSADVILVFGWAFKSHLKAIRFFHKKKKILFRGDSTFVTAQSWLKSLIRKQFLQFVYRHVDTCLYVGTNNRNYYKRCSVADTKLLFAPHAIDNDRFYDRDGNYQLKADTWKAELGIEPEAVTLLFAGKLTKDKNAQLLIDTLPLLSGTNFPVHLIIVGNGEFEMSLKSRAAGNTHIHFVPFQNQAMMPVVYRLGDIFVMPTLTSDTWGLAINEAMASGRAVVVSNMCGAAVDLVKEGENGFVFNSTDPDDFRKKILTLCHDKNLCLYMGANSGEMIKGWSLLQVAEAIENAVNIG